MSAEQSQNGKPKKEWRRGRVARRRNPTDKKIEVATDARAMERRWNRRGTGEDPKWKGGVGRNPPEEKNDPVVEVNREDLPGSGIAAQMKASRPAVRLGKYLHN